MLDMHAFNPSGFLFPLSRLATSSATDVSRVLDKLDAIYSKQPLRSSQVTRREESFVADPFTRLVPGFSVRWDERDSQQELVPDSGYASAEEDDEKPVRTAEEDREDEDDEAITLIRNDAFERDFTVRWLTGFISRSSFWTYPDNATLTDEELEARENLVEKAASLLASYAGAYEEDQALTREFVFPLQMDHSGLECETIRVELNDAPLSAGDHSSVGLQSWASSIIFAKMLCENPISFGLKFDREIRILELGAGTGLLSIVAAKVAEASRAEGECQVDIVATDYHPDVLANLQRNVETNFPLGQECGGFPVDVQLFDWQFPSCEIPFDEVFDVILAADVIYDPCHAEWISACAERLLRRPSPTCPDGGVFWLAIPIRTTGRHEGLGASVPRVFPHSDLLANPSSSDLSLKIVASREISRCNGVGRVDEAGYRLFQIVWA